MHETKQSCVTCELSWRVNKEEKKNFVNLELSIVLADSSLSYLHQKYTIMTSILGSTKHKFQSRLGPKKLGSTHSRP